MFGLAGSTGTSKNVALTVTQNQDNFGVITVQGGSDVPNLNSLDLKVAYPANGTQIGTLQTQAGPFTVGQIFNTTETIKGYRLIISGKFTDGSTQILLDRNY